MAKFRDFDALEVWLRDQPREVSIAIAARAALSAAPALISLDNQAFERGAWAIIMPYFRCVALSWLTGAWPHRRSEVRSATVYAAFDVAPDAYHDALGAALSATLTSTIDTFHDTNRVARSACGAVKTAATLDHSRGTLATAAIALKRVENDVTILENNRSPSDLMQEPLWHGQPPIELTEQWPHLQRMLLDADQGWEVWTQWYQDRLIGGINPNGRPVIQALELERCQISNNEWNRGPAHVNALIADMEARHRSDPPDDLPTDLSDDQPRALHFTEEGGRIGGSGPGGPEEGVADNEINRSFRDRAARMAGRMLEIAAAEAGQGNAYHDLREKAEELLEALGEDTAGINPALLAALAGEMRNALTADDDRRADPELADRPPLSTELREALANLLESADRLIAHDDLLASLTRELPEQISVPASLPSVVEMTDGAVDAGAATDTARRDLVAVDRAAPGSGIALRSSGNFIRTGFRITWDTMAIQAGQSSDRVRRNGIAVARWIIANRNSVAEYLASPRKAIADAIKSTTHRTIDKIEAWLKRVDGKDDDDKTN